MDSRIEIVKKEQQQISNWSGGSTTQLAIFPKEATLQEKNFKWRLSSAMVEVEESIFTLFPSVWRLIMVLEGELRLEHEGHHSVTLKPYQQDSFSGDWHTRSYGRVKDFNLMLSSGYQGSLEALEVSERIDIFKEGNGQQMTTTECFYCAVGAVDVLVHGEYQGTLDDGDLLIAEKGHRNLSVQLVNRGDTSKLVKAVIQW